MNEQNHHTDVFLVTEKRKLKTTLKNYELLFSSVEACSSGYI